MKIRESKRRCQDCHALLALPGTATYEGNGDRDMADRYLYECSECGAVWQSLPVFPWLIRFEEGVVDLTYRFRGEIRAVRSWR